MAKYTIFYHGPNGDHRPSDKRYDTADEAEKARQRTFSPHNWHVVKVVPPSVETFVKLTPTTQWSE